MDHKTRPTRVSRPSELGLFFPRLDVPRLVRPDDVVPRLVLLPLSCTLLPSWRLGLRGDRSRVWISVCASGVSLTEDAGVRGTGDAGVWGSCFTRSDFWFSSCRPDAICCLSSCQLYTTNTNNVMSGELIGSAYYKHTCTNKHKLDKLNTVLNCLLCSFRGFWGLKGYCLRTSC